MVQLAAYRRQKPQLQDGWSMLIIRSEYGTVQLWMKFHQVLSWNDFGKIKVTPSLSGNGGCMRYSFMANRTESLNAKVGAITLAAAALMTLLLSHTTISLAPLRILTLAITAFAMWSFCDEMGLRKPLNRAGFIFFVIAAITKVQISLGLATQFVGRYYLLYAAFLMLAVLFWSVAFLHRQRELKVVGAVGVLATLAPVVAIVVGHIVVGVGAAIGIGALLAATDGHTPSDLSFVVLVERIFGLWSYVAAWLLWRGYIVNRTVQQ